MSYVYTTTYTTYYPTASCPWPEGHPPDQGASQSSSSVVHAYSSSSASNGPPPQSAQNGTCYCPTPQGLSTIHRAELAKRRPVRLQSVSISTRRDEDSTGERNSRTSSNARARVPMSSPCFPLVSLTKRQPPQAVVVVLSRIAIRAGRGESPCRQWLIIATPHQVQ